MAELDDPERWAVTWRAYQRKYFGAGAAAGAAADPASIEVPVSEGAAA
ncbi:hypothetical protein [Leifsonia aquatica]|nr:hypothetical protein [Leifsonia aquatica]